MRVREATPADALEVFAVNVAAARRLGPSHYTDEQVRAWADKRGEGPERYALDDDAPYFAVAERDTSGRPGRGPGRVVGYGSLDARDGEVTAVYVHPDYARSGVGAAILAHLEGRAREAVTRELELHSSLNAVEFYEANGWERTGEYVHDYRGVEFPLVVMRKALRESESDEDDSR